MGARMFGKVVAAHKPLIALGTRELLLAGMCSHVPLKLVGAHESLAAKQPVAEKRPFAAVPAQVRFEVRRLGVDFAAAGNVACVLGGRRRRWRRRFRRRSGDGLSAATVGAVAARTVRVADILFTLYWRRALDDRPSSALDSGEGRTQITNVAFVDRRRR